MNKIIIEVSIGELLDKISILEIKKGKIKDSDKIKYITDEHSILKDQLDKNVRYEPDIALFTPKDNPLHFYEKILDFASINLTKKGIIYLEINPNFTKEFNQILTNYSINHVNFKDDFRGKKRLVKLIF